MSVFYSRLLSQQNPVSRYATILLVLGTDVFFTLVAFYMALLIVGDFKVTEGGVRMFGWAPAALILIRGISFAIFKTYLIIIRYVGEKDLRNVLYAVTTSSIVFLFIVQSPVKQMLPKNTWLSIVIVDYLMALVFLGGFRMVLRIIFEQLRLRHGRRTNVAIFGAGELGATLERILKRNPSYNYNVSLFFDDNPKVHRKMLNGIRIFSPEKSFERVVQHYNIQIAIIAIRDLSEERRIEFIDLCLKHKIKVLKMPPTESLLSDNRRVGQLRKVRFEDLLNRPPIQLDENSIRESVTDKVVLVTGCAGSIGSEIVRQLLRYQPRQIIGLDQAETPLAKISLSLEEPIRKGVFRTIIGNVQDKNKLDYLFKTYKPDYVFHAAAYKHVPIMEAFPEEAIKVNVLGTQTLADTAVRHKVRKFVMISTDKVVNPSNVMGASKRIAEIYVQALNGTPENQTQFITTRFGNVLGSNGSVIPIFRQQIAKRQPLTVTHPEVTRFFMTIPEACQLVLEAGAMGKGGEIFIFDMGKPVRILELAERLIQLSGLVPYQDIPIKFTGLRPGEKLTEELLDKDESSIPTHHPKIKKARVRPADYAQMNGQIRELIQLALDTAPPQKQVSLMKAIVPEFSSQNSVFESLDESKKVISQENK